MAKYVKTEQGYQEIETTVAPVVNQKIETTVPSIVAPMVGEKMDKNNPVGTGSFSMGRKTGSVIGTDSHAEGNNTTASGNSSHAEGGYTKAIGGYSHAEGYNTKASSVSSHAEGNNTTASGFCSHAEGSNTKATSSDDTVISTSDTIKGYYTHAEGYGTVAYGRCSHAEGNGTKSSGIDSHAEGFRTVASGNYSHAEGEYTTASGSYSHAEGSNTEAFGYYSHAEGQRTTASGYYSHAEGISTTASRASSHAEGNSTTASGENSHVEGTNTKASGENSHVEGKYNIEDTANKYAHIVGNGTSNAYRSNAHTLDWNGVGWFKDSVKVGGSSQDDSAAKTLATTDYVDTTVSTKISGKQDTLIQSGAAVGQIAKITAVDSNGKPTAWQAVDMPSGGGTDEEYELIFTDTVTEDTAGYSRDTDANGNTFALKKVILIVFTPPYEESDTSYGRGLGFLPTTRWGRDCIGNLHDSIKSSAGGTGNYDVIFAEIIMGYQMCTARFESQNTTNVFSVMQPVTKAGATGLQFVGDATKLMQISNPTGNMTCVKIVGYASPIIAKNTQIALYGVRA